MDKPVRVVTASLSQLVEKSGRGAMRRSVVSGLAALVVACSGSGPRATTSDQRQATLRPAPPAARTTPRPTPPSAPAGSTIIKFSGTGNKDSAPFAAPNEWTIAWSYTCTEDYGFFGITVADEISPLAVVQPPDAPHGSGTDWVYRGGPHVHLEVIAPTCTWQLEGHTV